MWEEKYQKKIANRWAEMGHPPSTVEKAFKLASDMEKLLQVADSFKLEFPSYPSKEVNEMSTEETSGMKQNSMSFQEVRKVLLWIIEEFFYILHKLTDEDRDGMLSWDKN